MEKSCKTCMFCVPDIMHSDVPLCGAAFSAVVVENVTGALLNDDDTAQVVLSFFHLPEQEKLCRKLAETCIHYTRK